jgi:hypothetical protein
VKIPGSFLQSDVVVALSIPMPAGQGGSGITFPLVEGRILEIHDDCVIIQTAKGDTMCIPDTRIQHLINGQPADSAQRFETVNPATQAVLAEVADGGAAEVFENNVFVGNGADGTQCVIDLGSLTSTSFKHNTLHNVSPRVGGINSSAGGSGTYTENIMISSSFNGGPSGSCTSCTFTHNLFSSGGNGTNNNITWRDLINETWVSKPLAQAKVLPSDEVLFGDVIAKLA